MNYKGFIRWIQAIILQFRPNSPSLIVLLLFYLLFWNFPQTSDLHLVLNQNGLHWIQVPLFFSSLSVIAFLMSNVNDFIRGFDTKNLKASIKSLDKKEEYLMKSSFRNYFLKESSKQYVIRMFPKVLGTFLILIVAFSVENAFYDITKEDIFISAKLGLAISILLLFLSLNKFLANRFQKLLFRWKMRNLLSPLISVLCFLVIVYLGFKSQGGSESDIKRLFISLVLLAILFFNISTSYSKYIVRFKDKFGSIAISIVTLLLLSLYLFLVYQPNLLTDSINPLTIINVCIIGLFSLTGLAKLGSRILKVPLLSIVLVFLMILGFITASRENFSHYNLSAVEDETGLTKKRNSLESHFERWIQDRKELIETHNDSIPFKAIFVSAEGGGSRAGLWSFLVHSYLYDRNPDYFDKHLVSMTGASGGSVGNVMFYNIANHNFFNPANKISLVNENEKPFKYKASKVYQGDFLSTSIAALLGRDLIQSVLGILRFNDRGALLENEWENAYHGIFDRAPSLKNEFLSMPVSKGSRTAPLLIVNTVNVQKGEYAVISPVTFKENENTIGVFDDFLDDFSCVRPKETIKKSSAMSVTARFPFVSPVARVEKVGQFMDAGYYDNIGGTVTRRLHEVFEQVLRTKYDTVFQKKIAPVFLVLANKEESKFAKDCIERKKKPFSYAPQWVAPMLGVVNATFAQNAEMKKTFGAHYLIESERKEVPLDTFQMKNVATFAEKTNAITPILPLGRYLSNTVIRSMENNFDGTLKQRLDALVVKKEQ